MLEVAIEGHRGAFDYALSFQSSARVTALFGRSGAGKSTVIDAISGQITPQHGRIKVNDAVFFDSATTLSVPVRNRHVGHIFQDARLFPHMSVKRNLTYARWAGRRYNQEASFDAIVHMLGLEAFLDRRPAGLSGGEKQRVAIGRALLSDPCILLMDEPLSALDAWRKNELLPYFRRLADEGGVQIVYVSHDLDELIQLADDLILIEAGHVQQAGQLSEVLPKIQGQFDQSNYSPSSLLRAAFESFDAMHQMSWLDLGRQKIALLQQMEGRNAPFFIRIYADNVGIALQKPQQTSFQNILQAHIKGIDRVSSVVCHVTLDVDGQDLLARLTTKAQDDLKLRPGLAVYAMIKSVSLPAAF